MQIISGADGCRAGWVVVSKDIETGLVSWRLCRDAHSLIFGEPVPQILAIDIPIGLSEQGARACDTQARRLLGPGRGSSVFPAPLRSVLGASSYREACAIRSGIEGKKMSKQTWMIIPKIREVDKCFEQDKGLQLRVREVHPELCFFYMGEEHPARFNKKKLEGREERLRLLEPFFGEAPRAALSEKRALASQTDDILDAFAALWTAERIARGIAGAIPGEPSGDSRGLWMEMVF
jgi:predicted RNase H-like nuclease